MFLLHTLTGMFIQAYRTSLLNSETTPNGRPQAVTCSDIHLSQKAATITYSGNTSSCICCMDM